MGVALVAVLPAWAGAERPGAHFSIEAATEAPIYLGGGAVAELPGRLRLSGAFGYLPGAYVDGINGAVVGLGGYDERTAKLVRSSLDSSAVWQAQLGWRPFASAGFFVDAGYQLVALGGGTSGEQAIAVALGRDPPEGGQRTYDIASRLHLLETEVGWEWWVAERLSLRASLGWAFIVDSKTEVTPTGDAPPIVGELVSVAAERYIDDALRSWVHTPTLGFAIGWRLF